MKMSNWRRDVIGGGRKKVHKDGRVLQGEGEEGIAIRARRGQPTNYGRRTDSRARGSSVRKIMREKRAKIKVIVAVHGDKIVAEGTDRSVCTRKYD